MGMFKQFLGVPPHDPAPNGILVDKSKREFLKGMGAMAVAGVISYMPDLAEATEFKSPDDVYAEEANRKSIDGLNGYLLAKGWKLNNPKADNIEVFNDANKIVEIYNQGGFHNGSAKFYKPHSTALRQAEMKRSGNVWPPKDFEELEIKVDLLMIADVVGTVKDSDISDCGFAMLKKGTKIIRKKIENSNGKTIYENYISECFNKIHAGHKMCPTSKCK